MINRNVTVKEPKIGRLQIFMFTIFFSLTRMASQILRLIGREDKSCERGVVMKSRYFLIQALTVVRKSFRLLNVIDLGSES